MVLTCPKCAFISSPLKRRESQDLPCRAIVRIQLLLVKSLEQCLVGSKCCVNYRFVNLDGLEQGSNRICGCQGSRVEAGRPLVRKLLQ